jgi:Type II secretion system (T2SS), protein M subtype b
MLPMSKSMSRAAAITLLILAIAIPVFAIAMPLALRFQDLAQAIEHQQQQLEQFSAVAARGADLPDRDRQRQTAVKLGEFLAGDSDLVLQANLQTAVSRIAQTSGVRIQSARKLPDRARPPLKLAGIGINLTTDIGTLQKLLHAIEASRPYLFVESADLAPLGQTASASGGSPLIEVRLDVFAAIAQGR